MRSAPSRPTRVRGPRAASDRGALLVELLVSMLVFGLVSAASLQVLTSSDRAQAAAQDRVVATRIARSEIDALRSRDPGLLAVDPGATGYRASFEGAPTVTAVGGAVQPGSVLFVDGQRFTITRDVLWQAVGSETQAYRRLVVVVAWPSGSVRIDSGVRELGGG